jgi:hypothetical protein
MFAAVQFAGFALPPAPKERVSAMTDTTASAAPADPGLFARFIGVITSPKATMEAVVAHPRPFGILLVVAIVMAAFTAGMQSSEVGRQASLDMQVQGMERFGMTVSDQMYAQMEEQSRSPIAIVWTVISQFVFLPIMALFFTALFWAIFNALLGGSARFKQVLAVVTHSMVIMALGVALTIPVQLMQGQMTMQGPFNLGVLVPMMDENSFVARFLSWISLFTLWQTFVTAIGLGVLYRRKTTPIAVGLIAMYAGVVAVVVAAFSAFMNRG